MKPVYLDYRLRAALHRLGRVGVLGLALLAGAAMFYFSTVRPAQNGLATLQDRLERVAHRDAPGRALRPSSAISRMNEFMDFFPPLESAPRWLNRVYAIARREKLELPQGAYKLSEDPALLLSHYHVSFPVRGDYLQIRRFIAQVLDEVPFASLESVTFQRQRVSDSAVEANVSLTLHLRAAPKSMRMERAEVAPRLESAAMAGR